MVLNILLLEDDPSQLNAYRQALEDDDLQDSYNLIPANNVHTAWILMEQHEIHAAIMDLKVPAEEDSEPDTSIGIQHLETLLRDKQFPIIVVSANISSISVDDTKIPPHLEKLDRRTGVHSDAFQHFEKIKDLLEISPLFPEAIGEINSEFHKSFWEMWGHWHKINSRFNLQNRKKTKTFLKRYVCSHLIEKWKADDLFNEMHHTEFYTYPPSKDRIHTGDILELENEFWIVMTAPCDLSNSDYLDNLTLLKCQQIELHQYDDVVKPFKENLDERKKEKQRNVVKRYFTDPPVSKHYLPPWTKTGNPVNVLFKDIKTIPFSGDHSGKLKSNRKATLSFHFLPYLLQRYGTYVSRIGQYEISTDDYIDYLISVIPDSKSKS